MSCSAQASLPKMWRVYLVKCRDGSLYCGITTDLNARIQTHNAGKGAKYTRGRRPVVLVAATGPMLKGAALKLEAYIKKQPVQTKVKHLLQGAINV